MIAWRRPKGTGGGPAIVHDFEADPISIRRATVERPCWLCLHAIYDGNNYFYANGLNIHLGCIGRLLNYTERNVEKQYRQIRAHYMDLINFDETQDT